MGWRALRGEGLGEELFGSFAAFGRADEAGFVAENGVGHSGDGGEVGAVESTPCGGEVFAVSELSEVGSDCLYGPVPGCSWVDGVEVPAV